MQKNIDKNINCFKDNIDKDIYLLFPDLIETDDSINDRFAAFSCYKIFNSSFRKKDYIICHSLKNNILLSNEFQKYNSQYDQVIYLVPLINNTYLQFTNTLQGLILSYIYEYRNWHSINKTYNCDMPDINNFNIFTDIVIALMELEINHINFQKSLYIYINKIQADLLLAKL